MSQPIAAYRGRTKYDERKSRQYQMVKAGKHLAEMRLVDRAFARVPKMHRVLDVPCGGGRVTIHLAKSGYIMTAADLSESMIGIARENILASKLDCIVGRQDIEKLTLADKSFDTIISFRLFHHFPTPEIRQRAVMELCRAARKYVVLSYFSPRSITSLKRKLRQAFGGKKSQKFSTPLFEVEGYFQKAGFQLVRDFAQLPLIHTMHLALFERTGETRP